MEIYYQEFFAPVALIFPVKDEKEAIKLANDSSYGLGSIITKDIERGKRVARQIETGMVFINAATWTAPPGLPFGGVKNSGYGRELSDLGITEFVNKKLIRVA